MASRLFTEAPEMLAKAITVTDPHLARLLVPALSYYIEVLDQDAAHTMRQLADADYAQRERLNHDLYKLSVCRTTMVAVRLEVSRQAEGITPPVRRRRKVQPD